MPQPASSPTLNARPNSYESHFVTASVPPMLINGHKMHGRQQPPHSVESALSCELREVSEKWVTVGWGLDRGNHSQLEGFKDRFL